MWFTISHTRAEQLGRKFLEMLNTKALDCNIFRPPGNKTLAWVKSGPTPRLSHENPLNQWPWHQWNPVIPSQEYSSPKIWNHWQFCIEKTTIFTQMSENAKLRLSKDQLFSRRLYSDVTRVASVYHQRDNKSDIPNWFNLRSHLACSACFNVILWGHSLNSKPLMKQSISTDSCSNSEKTHKAWSGDLQ